MFGWGEVGNIFWVLNLFSVYAWKISKCPFPTYLRQIGIAVFVCASACVLACIIKPTPFHILYFLNLFSLHGVVYIKEVPCKKMCESAIDKQYVWCTRVAYWHYIFYVYNIKSCVTLKVFQWKCDSQNFIFMWKTSFSSVYIIMEARMFQSFTSQTLYIL